MSIAPPSINPPVKQHFFEASQVHSWDKANNTYVLKTTQETFTECLTKDLNNGQIAPDAHRMVEALLSPSKKDLPKVQVKTFAVDGVQAKDIIFMQRLPPRPDSANIVLFIPQKDGTSFHSFKTLEDMNGWLKTLAGDPKRLETFSQHFAQSGVGATKRVIDTMTRFKDNDTNAIVGPYANEGNDVFARLDKATSTPPALVNGLTHLKEEGISPEGRVLYSGLRPDGEKVIYEYDAYGNFQGADKKGIFYFVKNGLNDNYKPLVPMTNSEFRSTIINEAENNVGANDIRGLYEELLTHLEQPASGIGDALKVFGVSRSAADTVERYLDNPFSALLLDLNTNNQIGKVLGVDKKTMDAALKEGGDIAQGFVPYYGQARMLGAVLAKALRNEQLSDQEKRDLADGLALKPDSPARQHLPVSEPAQGTYRAPIQLIPEETKSMASSREPSEAPSLNSPEPAPETPAPSVEQNPNRLLPSQWHDISHYAVAQGEQLIAGVKPNGRGIYQVKEPQGTDRWLIRLADGQTGNQVYEIDGKFKLSDGYVNVIDPHTKRPVMTVHSASNGTWEPINGPGGIKWPWQSSGRDAQTFDPGAYDYPAPNEASTSRTNEKIDKQLKKDAETFYKKAKTKPRPIHPPLPRNASPGDVINTIYQKSLGMIIGEDHSQAAGIRTLIDNAAELKKNNVTTLYSEGFDHSMQPDLDRFHETGEFSSALIKNLKLIDRAHSGHEPYTNRELLLTMRKHGIRVKAIDVPSAESVTTRLKTMNYYATSVIERDQAANPGAKWVARVGSAHVFTYDDPSVRGISELTGATGVSVDDAPSNQATSVTQSRDGTEFYIALKNR